MIAQGLLAARPNQLEAVTIGPLNKLRLNPAAGIGVNVLDTRAENWGMVLVVRTWQSLAPPRQPIRTTQDGWSEPPAIKRLEC